MWSQLYGTEFNYWHIPPEYHAGLRPVPHLPCITSVCLIFHQYLITVNFLCCVFIFTLVYQWAGGQGVTIDWALITNYLSTVSLFGDTLPWSNTLGGVFFWGCFCSTVARLSLNVTHDPYIWQRTWPGLVKGFPDNTQLTTVLHQTRFHHRVRVQQTPAYVPRHSLTHALESKLTCTQTQTLWGHRKGWELSKLCSDPNTELPQEGLRVIKAVLRPKYHRKGWELSKLCSDLSTTGRVESYQSCAQT